jgi:F-type H+-transporting ATPase subunit delta
MKTSKQARRDGKTLFSACVVDGRLDESRVRSVVEKVIGGKPRGYLGTLSHFKRLVKLHLDGRRAIVENAAETAPELQAQIRANLERRYGAGLDLTFSVNPALLGGLRVRVGSDVYDGSVRAGLDALQNRF